MTNDICVHTTTARRGEGGFALLSTLALLVVFGGLSLTYFAVSSSSVRHVARRESDLRLEATATSVAQLAAQDLWNRYVVGNGGTAGDLDDFRAFLASGDLPMALDPGAAETVFGPESDVSQLIAPSVGDDGFGGLRVVSATARRRDTKVATDIEVTVAMATGDVGGAERVAVRQSFSVGGEEFKGFEYALLSNNVNCIMCHATFDTADRFFNTDASKLSSFDRVKVGTLSTLQIRAHDANSAVFGTIHSRGALMDAEGNPLASLNGTTLTGALLDAAGKIVEDTDASIFADDLTLAVGDPLPQNGQLYLDYPTDKEKMTDGELPVSFPPAIPDLDGDKQVDPAEFELIAESATGTLGGTIVEVATGSTFEAALAGGSLTPQVDGTTDGNLVLMGTPDNPIQIDGKIAVDGDVVIFGTVKGEGAIYASGNVYIVGDVTYLDGVDVNGNRTFGIGADGKPNALALAAGGNLIAGDHLSVPQWGAYKENPLPVTGDANGAFNFTMNEIAIFNRNEWMKTQTTLPGIDGSFVLNPSFVPNYTPSYYVLGEGDPVFILNGANLAPEDQHKLYYDPASGLWKGLELLHAYDPEYVQSIPAGDPSYGASVIKSLSPAGNWMSEATLKSLKQLAEAFHAIGPMQVDALLYTNNAAFAMLRNMSRYKGHLVLNGGLVAADTGVLLPGGLDVNFDPRPAEFVDLFDLTKPVEMRRTVWRRVSFTELEPES
jgi:hypothetical protein